MDSVHEKNKRDISDICCWGFYWCILWFFWGIGAPHPFPDRFCSTRRNELAISGLAFIQQFQPFELKCLTQIGTRSLPKKDETGQSLERKCVVWGHQNFLTSEFSVGSSPRNEKYIYMYIYITHQESGCANHPSWWQGQQLSTRKAFLPTYACGKIRELPPQTICGNATQKTDFHHLSETIRKCYNRCTVFSGPYSGPVIFLTPQISRFPWESGWDQAPLAHLRHVLSIISLSFRLAREDVGQLGAPFWLRLNNDSLLWIVDVKLSEIYYVYMTQVYIRKY